MKVRDKTNGQFVKDRSLIRWKKCNACGEKFYCRSQLKYETSKYCSRKCLGEANSKRMKGKPQYKMTEKTRKRISEAKIGVSIWGGKRLEMSWTNGEDNRNWKGDSVGYSALHSWIRRTKGKAEKCLICGFCKAGRGGCAWANIDGKYNRREEDYASLCPSCHKAWDNNHLPVNLWEMNMKGGDLYGHYI